MNYGITVCINHAPAAPSIAVISHQSGRRDPNNKSPMVWGRPHDVHDRARLVRSSYCIVTSTSYIQYDTWGIKNNSVFNEPKAPTTGSLLQKSSK